jgi:hypothetical protein
VVVAGIDVMTAVVLVAAMIRMMVTVFLVISHRRVTGEKRGAVVALVFAAVARPRQRDRDQQQQGEEDDDSREHVRSVDSRELRRVLTGDGPAR